MTGPDATRFLLVCDTLPSNPWSRDRLPAIREAAADRHLDVMDVYEFHSREEAHAIHRGKGGAYFAREDVDWLALNSSFEERIRSHRPDVVILGTVDCYAWFLLPETVLRLRRSGIRVVGILGDDEFTHRRNRLYVPMFDTVVVYVREFVERYDAIAPGVAHWLPNSCCFPETDFDALQTPEPEKRFDVVLMGAPFGVRPTLVRALAASGISVGLFGSEGWRGIPDLAPLYQGHVPFEKIGDVMRSARIVLAPLEDHLGGSLHMNTKIWEAVKYGQFCITTRYEPLLRDYGLVEDEEIVMYSSVDDLVAKARRYVADVERRAAVARRLFERTRAGFDYVELYRALFRRLDAGPRPGAPAEATPRITIVDVSGEASAHPGFAQLNLSRRGWRRRLDAAAADAVETPYVILTRGGLRYSPYLNEIVHLSPDRFWEGRTRLRSDTPGRSGTLVDVGELVWTREAFRAQASRGRWSRRYVIASRIPFGYHDLRLCHPLRARAAYRIGVGVERRLREAFRRLRRVWRRWGPTRGAFPVAGAAADGSD
jgi:hypothetical protein